MPRLFVKQLTTMDFSYLHPQRGLLGESWFVDVELTGHLDDQGMVLDFAEVKGSIKQLIDLHFDHRLLVPTCYPGVSIFHQGDEVIVDFTCKDERKLHHKSPLEAVCLIDADVISTESVTEAIQLELQPLMPGNVQGLGIHLYPETTEVGIYQYSHGLKEHCGNCQRIAHGHRSRLEIYRNDERDAALEKNALVIWRDIYIGTEEDVAERHQDNGIDYLVFRYQSGQGDFELSLPAASCYLIDEDTTVEHLAQHLADKLKSMDPESSFRVVAYEGIGKGAIGEA